jgi:2-phosphosulfolactate phosphatase
MFMQRSLEVLFSPAEFMALRERDLSQTVCVVFDILRATSSMMTALANGAAQVIPAAELDEALALRKADPTVLLAGERDGVRILATQTGSIDFDLGNSPREFTGQIVRGRTIVISTTNGTRALRACAAAKSVLVGSFLGMRALVNWIRSTQPHHLLLVCAGTHDQAAYEDTLAAGALAEGVWDLHESGHVADSAMIARQIYQRMSHDLPAAMRFARNGRRLLRNPDLQADVSFCVRTNTLDFIAEMTHDGAVRRLERA